MRNRIEAITLGWAMVGGLCILLVAVLMVINSMATGLDMLTRSWGYRVPGIYGLEEIVKLLASVAALSFFPFCHLRGGHIAVEVIAGAFPLRVQQVNQLAVEVLSLVTAVFLAGWLAVGTHEVWTDRSVSGILAWPQWPFYVPGVVSMVLWALVAMLRTHDALNDLRGAPHGSA